MPLLGMLLELQFGYLPAPKLVSNAAFLVSSPRGALPAALGFCTGKVLFLRKAWITPVTPGPSEEPLQRRMETSCSDPGEAMLKLQEQQGNGFW